jgi:hypothetical protein
MKFFCLKNEYLKFEFQKFPGHLLPPKYTGKNSWEVFYGNEKQPVATQYIPISIARSQNVPFYVTLVWLVLLSIYPNTS